MNEELSNALGELISDAEYGREIVTSRGGTISAAAGFREIFESIAVLPPSGSVGTVIDNSVALSKTVPRKSISHCYVKELGGMSYRDCDNNTLLHTKPVAIKSYDANGDLIKEIPIPEGLQGTGKGVDTTHYDSINFETSTQTKETETLTCDSGTEWSATIVTPDEPEDPDPEIPEDPEIPTLPAPTISLGGDILTITDSSDLAEEFEILVDGEVRTTILAQEPEVPEEPNPEEPTLPAPTISLDGDTLTISDSSGLADRVEILFDGEVKTTIAIPDVGGSN